MLKDMRNIRIWRVEISLGCAWVGDQPSMGRAEEFLIKAGMNLEKALHSAQRAEGQCREKLHD